MRKSLLLLLTGFGLMVGCTAERQSDREGVQPTTVQKGNSKGLEFLADIPSLKGVSLQMSEADFVEILHRQKLDYNRGVDAGQTTYDVPVKDGGAVLFMFRDKRCSGIQRMSAAGGG